MKCPNCGKEIAEKTAYCEYCGMRIATKIVINHNDVRNNGISKEVGISETFSSWSKGWADKFVENYDFWNYLLNEHWDDTDYDLPLLICCHKFPSYKSMQKAYDDLCELSKNHGYGKAEDFVLLDKDENCWYPVLTCPDLPMVLLTADINDGQLIGWADYFIDKPPLPIFVDKKLSLEKCVGHIVPIKRKREVKNIKDFLRKHPIK